jgi:hypothetical protein
MTYEEFCKELDSKWPDIWQWSETLEENKPPLFKRR